MKAIRSLARRIFSRITADDSPASYYFMCGAAILIVGDAVALYVYEAVMVLHVVGMAFMHSIASIVGGHSRGGTVIAWEAGGICAMRAESGSILRGRMKRTWIAGRIAGNIIQMGNNRVRRLVARRKTKARHFI